MKTNVKQFSLKAIQIKIVQVLAHKTIHFRLCMPGYGGPTPLCFTLFDGFIGLGRVFMAEL